MNNNKKKFKQQKEDGSIFQRKDGRWVASLSLGVNIEGKFIKKVAYAKSEEEAIEKLEELKKTYANNKEYVSVSNNSFADLMFEWLMIFKKSNVTARTLENNIQNFKKHIEPYTKHIKLHNVTTLTIQKIINIMIEKNYANQTVKKIKFLFNQFYDYAIDNNWVSVNPAKKIQVKLHDRKVYNNKNSYKAISPEIRNKFIKALDEEKDSFIKPLCIILMYSGLRIGEALGIKWCNLDLKNKKLKIEYAITEIPKFNENGDITGRDRVLSDTKTTCSVREIPLLDIVINTLSEWKETQKLKSGKYNINLTAREIPIFANNDGSFRTYDGTRCIFERFLKRNDLKQYGIHFHGLRHTFSNMLFEMNENPKVIQQLLGHRDVKKTITVYNSVNNDYVKNATNKLNEVVTQNISQNIEETQNTKSTNEMTDDELEDYIEELILEKRKRRKK